MNSSILVWSGGDEQNPLVVSLLARLGVPSLSRHILLRYRYLSVNASALHGSNLPKSRER